MLHKRVTVTIRGGQTAPKGGDVGKAKSERRRAQTSEM